MTELTPDYNCDYSYAPTSSDIFEHEANDCNNCCCDQEPTIEGLQKRIAVLEAQLESEKRFNDILVGIIDNLTYKGE